MMKTNGLHKFGTAYVISESLHREHHLGSIEASVRADFEVSEEHVAPGAVKSEVLVSTSLFNQTGDVPTGAWGFEMFNASVIPSTNPKKYWEALMQRRVDYAGKRLRVYVAANLACLVKPLLDEVGFDEVLVMARYSVGFKTGMLWRYLPLCESGWEHVFCTGIDRYGPAFRQTLLQAGTSMTASVWMNRHFMPFAGPVAARPAWLAEAFGATSMARAMSGFLNAWEGPTPSNKYVAKVFDFTGSSRLRAMPTIDACFLWYAFWNRRWLDARPRLVSQVFYEYARICEVDFLLGGENGERGQG